MCTFGVRGFHQFNQGIEGLIDGCGNAVRETTSYDESVEVVDFADFVARHILCC